MSEEKVGACDSLTHYDFMKAIIGATLSRFPDGTRFNHDLDKQIREIYNQNNHPLLKEHRFDGEKGDSRGDLAFCIIDMLGGYSVGLSKWGDDLEYVIEESSRKVENMFVTGLEDVVEEAKGVLGEENFLYFAELGKKLKAIC